MAVNSGFTRRLPRFPVAQYRQQDYAPSVEDQIQALFSSQGVDPSRHLSGQYEDPMTRISRLAQSGRSMEDIASSIGRLAQNTPLNERTARQRASLEFDPQEQVLERSLSDIGRQRDRDLDVNRRYAEFAQTGLNDVFSKLQQSLIQNNTNVSSTYGNAGSAVAQGYQQAAGAQQAGSQAVLGGLSGQARSLGLEGAEADPASQIQALQSQLVNATNTQGANAQTNMGFLQGALNGIGLGSVKNAGLEQANMQQRLSTDVLDAISQIMLGAQDRTNDVVDQLGSLAGQRGARIGDLREQLDERDFERNFRQEGVTYERGRNSFLDSLAAEIQRGSLGLQRDELAFNRQRWGSEADLANRRLGLDEQLGMGQLGVQQQELEIRARQVEGELAHLTPGTLEYQMAQAELDHLRTQTDVLRRTPQQLSGRSGVEQYTMQHPISPTARQNFDRIADMVRREVSEDSSANINTDPVGRAMELYETLQPSRDTFGNGTTDWYDQMASWRRMEPQFRTLFEILFGAY